MPIISSFYGMTIKIYFMGKEHDPPHIHVIYGEYSSAISINNCEILDGDLPEKAFCLVKEWVKIHKKELLNIWETQNFRKIEPLI